MKSLLQKSILKKIKGSLKDDDNVIGIFLFGSFARRYFGPKSDVDVFILITERKYYEQVQDKIVKITSRRQLQPVIRSLSELEKTDFVLLRQIFSEGKIIYWNSLYDLDAANILKIKPYILYTFSLRNLKQNTKLKYNYELYGKKGNGYLSRINGMAISKSCIIVPVEKEKSIEVVFNKYRVKYDKMNIWK